MPPERIVDYLALVGDAIDNIPGVPLIGPKMARELLQKYDTLEGVFEHINVSRPDSRLEGRVLQEVRGRMGELLVGGWGVGRHGVPSDLRIKKNTPASRNYDADS